MEDCTVDSVALKTPEDLYNATLLGLSGPRDDEELSDIVPPMEPPLPPQNEAAGSTFTAATSTCSPLQVPLDVQAHNTPSVTISECTEDATMNNTSSPNTVVAQLVQLSAPLFDDIPNVAEENMEDMAPDEYMAHARQVYQAMANLSRLYPHLRDVNNHATAAGVSGNVPISLRPSTDPPSASDCFSTSEEETTESTREPEEMEAEQQQPEEIRPDPPAFLDVRSSLLHYQPVAEEEEEEEANASPERDRSPSPVVWQSSYLEGEQHQLSRANSQPCPLPALEYQWSQRSIVGAGVVLRRWQSLDPPSVDSSPSPRPWFQEQSQRRPDPQEDKEANASQEQDRSPSPFVWQRSYLEGEQHQLSRANSQPCPLPALEYQWSQRSIVGGGTVLRRCQSLDPPSVDSSPSPRPWFHEQSRKRPDPPLVNTIADGDDESSTMAIVGRKVEFPNDNVSMLTNPTFNPLSASVSIKSGIAGSEESVVTTKEQDRQSLSAATKARIYQESQKVSIHLEVAPNQQETSANSDGDDEHAIGSVLVSDMTGNAVVSDHETRDTHAVDFVTKQQQALDGVRPQHMVASTAERITPPGGTAAASLDQLSVPRALDEQSNQHRATRAAVSTVERITQHDGTATTSPDRPISPRTLNEHSNQRRATRAAAWAVERITPPGGTASAFPGRPIVTHAPCERTKQRRAMRAASRRTHTVTPAMGGIGAPGSLEQLGAIPNSVTHPRVASAVSAAFCQPGAIHISGDRSVESELHDDLTLSSVGAPGTHEELDIPEARAVLSAELVHETNTEDLEGRLRQVQADLAQMVQYQQAQQNNPQDGRRGRRRFTFGLGWLLRQLKRRRDSRS